MFKLIIYIALILLLVYMIANHIKIKYSTFLKRGYFIEKSPYGIYCYHNKQGSGKTQSAVTFVLENSNMPIYANLKSLKGVKYNYFSGFYTLLKIGTQVSNCIIFYDELFKGLYKGKKMTPVEKELLMDFMSQMRKRHIIFITTAQEWLEIPIEFRRYVRYDIECSIKSVFGVPIIKKIFHNTELIKWDNLENEYVSPIIYTVIEHGRKKIVNSYDTFEVISKEEVDPYEVFNEYNVNEYQIKDKISVPVSSLSEKKQNTKNVKQLANSFTTTIKSLLVSGQFTNKFTKNKNKKIKNNNNDNSVLDSVDNEFWGNINNNDLEDNVN